MIVCIYMNYLHIFPPPAKRKDAPCLSVVVENGSRSKYGVLHLGAQSLVGAFIRQKLNKPEPFMDYIDTPCIIDG